MFKDWQKRQEEKKQKKQEARQKQSAQELIPVKSVHRGLVKTPDNRIVGALSVSALNTELMSEKELTGDLLEGYESVLKEIDFPFQQMLVSVPIELKHYAASQEKLLRETDNPYRKKLLQGYVDHIRNLETSRGIMQRKRYVIVSEKIGKGEFGEADARATVSLNLRHIREGLESLELKTEPVGSLEYMKLFHVLFNYSDALAFPLESVNVSQMMERGME